MNKPREFWLIPWSVGYECRTNKPDGTFIHVIEKSAYDELEAKLKKTEAKLWIAKDSQLRTYDGLAQKADRTEELEAKLKIAVDTLTAKRFSRDKSFADEFPELAYLLRQLTAHEAGEKCGD
jgi:hypothetical protein